MITRTNQVKSKQKQNGKDRSRIAEIDESSSYL